MDKEETVRMQFRGPIKGLPHYVAVGYQWTVDGWSKEKPLFKFQAQYNNQQNIAEELRNKENIDSFGYQFLRHGCERITYVRFHNPEIDGPVYLDW